MTNQQIALLREIAAGIVDACKAADRIGGAPAGHLYAALMAHGCTLNQFNSIMAGLVRAGVLTQHGEQYRATGKAMR